MASSKVMKITLRRRFSPASGFGFFLLTVGMFYPRDSWFATASLHSLAEVQSTTLQKSWQSCLPCNLACSIIPLRRGQHRSRDTQEGLAMATEYTTVEVWVVVDDAGNFE